MGASLETLKAVWEQAWSVPLEAVWEQAGALEGSMGASRLCTLEANGSKPCVQQDVVGTVAVALRWVGQVLIDINVDGRAANFVLGLKPGVGVGSGR